MISPHLETISNKWVPSNVASCVSNMVPMSWTKPHSSLLAIKFYQLGEQTHNLTTDLDLIHQRIIDHIRHVFSHHCRHRSLWCVWICFVGDLLKNYNASNTKVSSKNQPILPSLKCWQELFTLSTPEFVADVLCSSPAFFTVQIRFPKHTRWRHYYFRFPGQQMTRWECNFIICIIGGSNNKRFSVDYSLNF